MRTSKNSFFYQQVKIGNCDAREREKCCGICSALNLLFIYIYNKKEGWWLEIEKKIYFLHNMNSSSSMRFLSIWDMLSGFYVVRRMRHVALSYTNTYKCCATKIYTQVGTENNINRVYTIMIRDEFSLTSLHFLHYYACFVLASIDDIYDEKWWMLQMKSFEIFMNFGLFWRFIQWFCKEDYKILISWILTF